MDDDHLPTPTSVARLVYEVRYGFKALSERMDTANGRTGKLEDHLREMETWKHEMQIIEAEARGRTAAVKAFRRRDIGLIGGGLALVSALIAALVPKLVEML